MNVDVAESTVGRRSQPKFLLLRSERRVLAGIFDGAGSWGSGPDAASHVLKTVRAGWQDALDELTSEQLASDLNATARELPRDLLEDEFGCAFSPVLALADEQRVTLVAAGLFSGLVLGAGQPSAPPRWHARPKMLVDTLVERGQLTAAEAPTAEVPDVCVGPFLGDGTDVLFSVTGDVIAPGERLVLAHHKLLAVLAAQPPPPDASAAALQSLSPRKHPATVIVLSR